MNDKHRFNDGHQPVKSTIIREGYQPTRSPSNSNNSDHYGYKPTSSQGNSPSNLPTPPSEE